MKFLNKFLESSVKDQNLSRLTPDIVMKDINTIYQIMSPQPIQTKEWNKREASKSPEHKEESDPTFYDLANAKEEKNKELWRIVTEVFKDIVKEEWDNIQKAIWHLTPLQREEFFAQRFNAF